MHAQDAVASLDDQQARELFLRGSAAFDRGNYEEALGYFQRAYELSGRPGLLYNVGHAAERLRRDELAIQSFEEYLRRVPEADNRESVEARIRLLRSAVASRSSAERASPSPDTAVPAAPPADDGGPGAAPIVLAVAGGVTAAAGVVMLVLASSAASNVTDAEDGTPWTDVSSDYDSAGTLGVIGGVAVGVGAAAAAVGIGWMIAGGSGEEDPVAVRIGPGSLALRGRF